MVKQYTANIYNWLKTKLNSTASNSKMNGTQSAGSSNLIARADHVHPVDTSRAPTSHASSATTYGVSSASNYGHAKASGTTPKSPAASASVGSETGSFARGDHIHPLPATASTSAKGIVQMDSTPTSSSDNAVTSGGLKTVLDTKQNEVETQAKVTQFTNKDRITLERIIERMNNPDSKALFLRPTDSSLPYYTFCENIKVATTSNTGVSLYLDGAATGTHASSVVLKKIDGTKIGDFNKRGTDPAGWGYSLVGIQLGVGIHYLYAEATFPDGSVRKSNILTVFVKDTNNLLSHNQWTAGEYENTIPVILVNALGVITNKYSDIGEQSLKLTKNAPSGSYSRIIYNQSIINKTVTISAHIRTEDTICQLLLLELDSNDSTIQSITVNIPSNSYGTFNISLISGSNNSKFVIHFGNIGGQGSDIYVDNIMLTSS